MLSTKTFCPFCYATLQVNSYEEFMLGKPQQCSACNEKFNIFRVYQTIFEEIPTGKEVSDESTDIIFSKYKIDGDSADVRRIQPFMQEYFSEEKLRKIVYDCVVYGTCIFRKIPSQDGGFSIEQINLQNYEIILEGRTNPGGSALGVYIKEIRNWRTGETISHNNLFTVYIQSDHHSYDTGLSRYGMWFVSWYILKIGPNAIINADVLGQVSTARALKNSYDRAKNEVKGTVYPLTIDNGKWERETLTTRMELIIMNILNREWSIGMELPRIVFDKDQ